MGPLQIFALLVLVHCSTTVSSRPIHSSACGFHEKNFRKDVNCRGGNLTNFPSSYIQSIKNVETVDLGMNNISSLSESNFSESNKRTIKKILLDHNQIADIPEDLFSGLSNFQQLYLSFNNLKSIGRQLCKLNSLRALDLSNNSLKVIASDAFDCLPNLEFLYLDNNNITQLPEDLFKGTSLQYVSLSGNDIKNMDNVYIPQGLKVDPYKKKEEGPEVSNNSLKVIASDASDCLPNLENLYLDNCNITQLPEDLFKDTSLKYVSLLENDIKHMNNVYIPQDLEVVSSNKKEEGPEVKETDNYTTIILITFTVGLTLLGTLIAIIVIIRRREKNYKKVEINDV